MENPIAHSAKDPRSAPQSYADHIDGVVRGARANASAMLAYSVDPQVASQLLAAICDGAEFHDFGKLDSDTQAQLRKGRNAKLNWDHIDAGVALLSSHEAMMAAWLARAHHAPGLPAKSEHFGRGNVRRLRGRRGDDADENDAQIARTDSQLVAMRAAHESALGARAPQKIAALHGLPMRLALSCLVDADHADTAGADGAAPVPTPPSRWRERLEALDLYVADLAHKGGARTDLRQQFYAACREREPDAAMIACEGPVGIGKTTAVLAYLLRRAMKTAARRLFIVAPFTAILSQTAKVLRDALVLHDERDRPFDIVAEHHHRADFSDIASRDLATLWSAPIILTTSVQFLETLSSNLPSTLRKLHMLPGSVVFFDEAHALAPVTAKRHLSTQSENQQILFVPQYWRWFCELADRWTCSFVYASGSLPRFWRLEEIVDQDRRDLQDLVPQKLVQPLIEAEAARVRYLTHPRFPDATAFLQVVFAEPGPRLVIMNTVQSAAIIAQMAMEQGKDVLHLSTALCPGDRDIILRKVKEKLDPRDENGARRAKAPGDQDWILVATSLVEAGVDISFATAFRERFGLTSLLQIAGRVNRHAEFGAIGHVHDFEIEIDDGLTCHPDARIPGEIVCDLFREGRLGAQFDAAQLVTESMRREVAQADRALDLLRTAERRAHYPDVASLGRVIEADTRLVVVDRELAERIENYERIPMRELLGGSVQIWASKISSLGLDEFVQRPGVYRWSNDYDPHFLGYMAGGLKIAAIARGDTVIW